MSPDVKETVKEQDDNQSGNSEVLPPSIILDVTPDGVSTVDENNEKIELTFDELIARIKNSHDKNWCIAQVKNIIEAMEDNVIQSFNKEPQKIISGVMNALFDNPHIQLNAKEIISLFDDVYSNRIDFTSIEIELSPQKIDEVLDFLFNESEARFSKKWLFESFKSILTASGKNYAEEEMSKRIFAFAQVLAEKINVLDGVTRKHNSQSIVEILGTRYKKVSEATSETWIPEKYWSSERFERLMLESSVYPEGRKGEDKILPWVV